jgi:dihydropteroate synthase
MSSRFYLRPAGLLYGQIARDAAAAGKAGLLAGGPVGFTMLDVIEGVPGKTRKQLQPFLELNASGEPDIVKILNTITQSRAPIANMTLEAPRIMGVVNVTPDSFSDGGLHATTGAAIAHARKLAGEGADILDIGGESTRPGSDPVGAEEEGARILPVIEGLNNSGAILSADTRKSAIMRQAAAAGAHILNDVSALSYDSESLRIAAETGLPVVLMHTLGDPKTMQDSPEYEDVALEVFDYLSGRIEACGRAGIEANKIIADVGIGFGKTLEHNLELLNALSLFHGLGVALLLGASRKRFIGTLAGEPDARARAPGSIAAALCGVSQGIQIVRVHDVVATRQALTIWKAINES